MSWKTLTTSVVYENDWMTVREDRVINPGGGENEYGHVHFKNKAVAIVPLDDDGNTWLVGQDRFTLGQYSWELPMGGAPATEDPLRAAQRELKEETGLIANDWSRILHMHVSNSLTDEEGYVYLARGLVVGEQDLDECENITVRKMPLDDAVQMAIDGRITDLMSIAALLRVARDFS